MSKTTLDDVLALVAKATPGDWRRDWNNDTGASDDYYIEWEEAGPARVHGDNQNADADAIAATVNYLRAHGDELRAALEDARRWREYVYAGRRDHSHCCKSCWHPYTPARGESEDCPKCGYDGISAIDAAQEVGK